MEITVLKCDRCKKEVDGLIEFSFINRNIKLDEQNEEDKPAYRPRLMLSELMLGSRPSNYPHVQGGLCLECVQEISRWLGHQENILTDRKEGV